jgi:hypothetical protein
MMDTQLKNQLRVAVAPAIDKAIYKFWEDHNMPSMSDDLVALMTEAALIPLFACADLEEFQKNNGLLK